LEERTSQQTKTGQGGSGAWGDCLETRGSWARSFSGGIRVEPQQNNKPAAVAKIDFSKSASSFSGELGEFRTASYSRKHPQVPQAKCYGLSPEEALP
jgi:hypothetical protein